MPNSNVSVTIRPADNGYIVERNDFGSFSSDHSTKVAADIAGAMGIAEKFLKSKSRTKKTKKQEDSPVAV